MTRVKICTLSAGQGSSVRNPTGVEGHTGARD